MTSKDNNIGPELDPGGVEAPNGKLGRKKAVAVTAVMAAVIIGAGILFFIMIHALQAKSDRMEVFPSSYTYATATSAGGMELHVLATKPSNVTLTAIHNNVSISPYYGINGGFFYDKALLSIAIVNSLPVNGAIKDYGSGNENTKYARGTLVWDGAANKLSVQVVGKASELKVMDHTRFWAQGGISMSLGRDAEWKAETEREQAPFPDDLRLRSGAVYDESGTLYLVVSKTKGTLSQFREAVTELVGGGKLVDGIFLDGDGSSQLRSREAQLAGDNRPVVQMLRIVK
ncbi:hypothetical protein [Paenibacillus radicis (ex Gao et al. 2016)]|uniref:Phosphodiester glycosidase domain-containing protein n=1 Tax=Paenibacillus radicis (ex Gao et al. 2016) TaxID=1737354 RepID=A0A917M5V1_9BACL|nr:hypothetical protein [Paenibacillus radicis (ex Gao et al. 2016)]GGG79869.1 hypothetical protein GCM10010918_41250 [Paenibacillus radicis (ex Gao et al. 2016)]